MVKLPANAKLICPKCGIIEHVSFDGYHFGDRLLEGVMFKAQIKNRQFEVTPQSSDDYDYLDNLNRAKWMRAAEEFISEYDVADCMKCNTQIILPTSDGWEEYLTPEESKFLES